MVKPAAIFALVFLLGAVAGAAVLHTWRGAQPIAPAGPPMMGLERRSGILAGRLGLDAAQRAQVEDILASYQGRFFDRVQALVGGDAELTAGREAMMAEVRAVLTDEQRARFDELLRDGPGFGPPGLRRPGMRRPRP